MAVPTAAAAAVAVAVAEKAEAAEAEEEKDIISPDHEVTGRLPTISEEVRRGGEAQARRGREDEGDLTAPKRARKDESVDVEGTAAKAVGEVERDGDATSQLYIATHQANLKDEDEPETGARSGSKRPRLD
eukprot:COSAG02_NODE_299_length_25349_cov_53.762020_11_plen_131_part_00